MKFSVGDKVFVNVSKKKIWMSHFETNFTGTVSERSDDEYAVMVLNKDKTDFVKEVAWYDADDLTKLPQTQQEKDSFLRKLVKYRKEGW